VNVEVEGVIQGTLIDMALLSRSIVKATFPSRSIADGSLSA
jgi:hypothetical protein